MVGTGDTGIIHLKSQLELNVGLMTPTGLPTKDATFNDDCKAFIKSYLNKPSELYQICDLFYVQHIFYKCLQAEYKR